MAREFREGPIRHVGKMSWNRAEVGLAFQREGVIHRVLRKGIEESLTLTSMCVKTTSAEGMLWAQALRGRGQAREANRETLTIPLVNENLDLVELKMNFYVLDEYQ
jgi:hypothetical protein